MHPTIKEIQEVVAKGDKDAIGPLLAEDVKFLPPTYWTVSYTHLTLPTTPYV